ncbi:MAG TPA: hypothetical protein VFX16_17320 [Pseudonocardiaceae bacterium]|nr:hypothetical protein [Pseudonocardiaceae bacterium]
MDTERTESGTVPRLLCRALLVLGGAVLATAAVWLISSASASAGTLPVPPATVLDSVAHSAADVVAPVVHPATVPAPAALPSQAAGGVRGVTGALRTAVSQLGAHVPAKNVVEPAPAARPATPGDVSTLVDRSTRAVDRVRHRALPTAAATGTAPTRAGFVLVRRLSNRSRTGATPTAVPTPPVLPVPVPWSPITVPGAPGGTGGAGAPGGGGLGLVDQTGTLPVPGLDLVRVVPVTAPLGRVTAGRQPGITPD